MSEGRKGYTIRRTSRSSADIALFYRTNHWIATTPMLTDFIPLDQCVKGHVYRMHSRNLDPGVFDGDRGFVGVREKFNSRYLFTEFHWDTGPPHGTVKPLEDLGPLPEDMETGCYLRHATDNLWLIGGYGDWLPVTRRPLRPDEPAHGSRHGFVDEFEDGSRVPDDAYPRLRSNHKLHEYLESVYCPPTVS